MTEEREQLWLGAPQRPSLSGGEVHVWRARLDVDAPTLRELWASLSPDERARADRFHFRVDRVHFVAARGGLRAVLSRYTGAAPHRLRFAYDEYGKPSLEGEAGGSRLRFNVSHSKGVALYAFAEGRAVGVDVEYVRGDFASLDIAEHFFSRSEVAALRAVAEGERAAAFFDCWTRKEAYIKARGEGLSHPLHLFTVSLTPGRPAALLSTESEPQEAARWSLVELFPGEGFRAALAVEGGAPSVRCWRWP
jgi:4'-phosphopantetheinyl transferase